MEITVQKVKTDGKTISPDMTGLVDGTPYFQYMPFFSPRYDDKGNNYHPEEVYEYGYGDPMNVVVVYPAPYEIVLRFNVAQEIKETVELLADEEGGEGNFNKVKNGILNKLKALTAQIEVINFGDEPK
jgi:hypothetical protein